MLTFRLIAAAVAVLATTATGAVFAAAPAATPAATPAADTVAKLRNTRTITLGVRESSRPFSFIDDNKQPAGYSVDLCLAAVEELKKELKLPDLKVVFKTVSGAERIPKLQSGEIDLECGSTTNTKARQAQVQFSYTIFVAGMRVLAPKSTRIENVGDLSGMTVALSKGTTSEKLFQQLNTGETPMKMESFASNDAAYRALRDGKVRAFPQDDALLTGLAARDKALGELQLSQMQLSVEPYGLMMRKGDDTLAAVVDRTLARLYTSNDIQAIYKKWFETDALNLKMGKLTRDSFLRPNKEAGVAMLLGYSI